MNIALMIPSAFWGGGEQYCYDLGKELQHNGHKVVAVSCRNGESADRFQSIMPTLCLTTHTRKKQQLSVEAIYRLARMLSKEKIDVIHVNTYLQLTLCILSKKLCRHNIKIIYTIHLNQPRFENAITRWAYKHIDTFCCVSKIVEETFIYNSPKYIVDRTRVVHNSIPYTEYNTAIDWHKVYNIPEEKLILSVHGRIHEEKGIDFIIDVLREILKTHKNIVLVISGTGENRYCEKLQHANKDLIESGSLFFIGFHSNIREQIKNVDVGLVPSIVSESFSLSALEYIQAGVPVISSNNGGQKEIIIDSKSGYLLPPQDKQQWTDKIIRLIGDTELRTNMSEQQKKQFDEQLNYNIFYNNIINLYKQ